jgi:hypothetical protein
MGNGLLAFAAGLGSGYLKAQQRDYERTRQDVLDAQNKELHDANMDQLNLAKKQRLGLADAAAPAVVNEQAASLGLADGSRTVYDMPNAGDVAGSDFRQLRRADQDTGNQTLARADVRMPAVPSSVGLGDQVQNPVDPQLPTDRQTPVNMSTTPTSGGLGGQIQSPADISAKDVAPASLGLGGAISMPTAPAPTIAVKGLAYDDRNGAKKAADAYNSKDAVIARQAAAYRAAGQPEKAMQLEANANQSMLADFQLSTAQTNHLNELANQKITDRAAANGGDWFKTMADIVTETSLGSLAGAKAEPRVSADGKMVQIVITRPDGTEQVLRKYGNNDQGQMRAQQNLMRVSPTTKIQWLHENATTDQAQSNFDRTHAETERHNVETENAVKTKAQMEFDPLGLNSQPVVPVGAGTGSASQAPGTGSNGTGTASQVIASGVKGPELLKALPGPLADQIKALADGRLAFPAGFALKTPYWQSMLSLTAQYDPTFDAINYGSRAATRRDFTAGKSAQSANALNTVLGHLDSLGQAADELRNTSIPLWNSMANAVQSGTGDPRVKKFEATKKAVVDELTRAWRGTGGSEGDIKTWSSTMNASNSPEQLHGVIGQIGELLESKIGALNDQYRKGMGTTAGGLDLMSQNSAKVLQKIKKRAGIDTPSQNAGTSALTAGQESNAPSNLPRIATPAEAMKLAPGTVFIDANGVTRTR